VGKTRIHELAAEFRIESGHLIQRLADMGIHVGSHRSALDDGQVALVRARWERAKRRGGETDGKRAGPQTEQARRKDAKRRRRPPLSQWTVPLAHRDTLAHLIDQAIREQHRGNTNGAWKSIEQDIERYCREQGEPRFASLSRPQLHKLRYGQRPSIGEAALWWLMFLIPDYEALFNTVHSPEARELLRLGNTFFEQRPLARSAERKEARRKVLEAMRASFPEAFEQFYKFVRGKSHLEETVALALDRVVEPFVLAGETGGIDREWDEMDATEKQGYVRSALQRERIFLTRDNDLRRTQIKGMNWFLDALAEPTVSRRRRFLRRRGADA
jgi:hypothetical protein